MPGAQAPLSSSPPRRGTNLLIAVFLAIVAATAAVVFALPWVAVRVASSRMARLAEALGSGRLEHGKLSFVGFSTLVVERLSFKDGPAIAVNASDVRVEVDPFAAVFGGALIQSVNVGDLSFSLGSDDAPFDPESVLGRATPHSAGGTGHLTGQTLPRVHVARFGGRARLTKGAVVVSDGTADLMPLDGLLDSSKGVLAFRAGVSAGPFGERQVEGEVTLVGARPEGAVVRVSPGLALDVASARVGVGGLVWRKGEIEVLSPLLRMSDRWSIQAKSVTIRFDEQQEVCALCPYLPSGTPDLLLRMAKTHSVREVEVQRPTLDVFVAVADAGADTGAEPSKEVVREGAFRRVLEGAFQRVKGASDSALGAAVDAARRMPVQRVAIHGATVRYVEPGRNPEDPTTSLANLDLAAERGPSGVLSLRVTFECPEARARANEARLSIDPEKRQVSLSLVAAKLPLWPYRRALPLWVQSGRETVLQQTDIVIELTSSLLKAKGQVGVSGVGLALPHVSSVPLKGLDLEARGAFTLDLARGRASLAGGQVALSNIKIPLEFEADSLANGPKLRVKARVERGDAQAMLMSLPAEAIPALEGIRLAGTFAAELDLDMDTENLAQMKLDFRPDVSDLQVLDLGRGVNLDLLRHEFLHRIVEGGGKVISRMVGPSSPDWVPYSEVPKALIDALTQSEDSQFFSHHGFSVSAIRRSLQVNMERGGLYQGASTLSQQLVKNLFLSREKTLVRKLQEVLITWQLEKFLSKEKILELYLNVIEWGPEVFGLKQAAMHYFGKLPSELNLLEIAFLVAIIPNPKLYHVYFERGALSPAFDARVKGLIREMARRGLVTKEEADEAMAGRLRFVPLEPPPPSNEGLGLEPPGPPPPPPEEE